MSIITPARREFGKRNTSNPCEHIGLDLMAERGVGTRELGIEKEGVFAVHNFAGYSPF